MFCLCSSVPLIAGLLRTVMVKNMLSVVCGLGGAPLVELKVFFFPLIDHVFISAAGKIDVEM